MLSKKSARTFFIAGTVITFGCFIVLTIDTFKKIPAQTNQHNLSESAIRGKHLFDQNNCMGCHTIMGEGAYYAPELTKTYEKRGAKFIEMMLTDPEKMFPGKRKMVKYNFTAQEKQDLIAFLKWVGEIDLNGFPPKPDLQVSQQSVSNLPGNQPSIIQDMCMSCHSLGGQGSQEGPGPALDGVGSKYGVEYLRRWLSNPEEVKPGTEMPNLELDKETIDELVSYLSKLK
ncbi:MAG: cytochrome c [Halobacteriovoraceae bacterium]|nr:cytochrome c [Halobacteriovoraceae bacterium]MCB9095824.1 cytochrome c [Halobacteriovoraceae bacterium]